MTRPSPAPSLGWDDHGWDVRATRRVSSRAGPARSTVLARNGNADPAADALERLSKITRAGGTDGAHGVEARWRALLSEGEAAERRYGEAIARLSRTRVWRPSPRGPSRALGDRPACP
jgi:hypothetical protein